MKKNYSLFFAAFLLTSLGTHLFAQCGTVSFTSTSTGGNGFLFNPTPATGLSHTYIWDFGDGTAKDTNAIIGFSNHTYTASGTYNVCLRFKKTNGCDTTVCNSVTITPPCSFTPSFTFSDTTGFFTATPAFGLNYTYIWSYGDGSKVDTTTIIGTTTHSYTTPGTYNACLTVADATGGCSKNVCQNITVTITGISKATENVKSFDVYPNPANDNITFNLNALAVEAGQIAVYDILGTKVLVLENNNIPAGIYNKTFDISSLAKGVYSLSFETPNYRLNKTIVKY